jgi:hypothetical protein
MISGLMYSVFGGSDLDIAFIVSAMANGQPIGFRLAATRFPPVSKLTGIQRGFL